MKIDELDLRELLNDLPQGGRLSLLGARTILLDTVALGLLRRQLVQLLGLPGARALFTQLGWAHGQRTAEALRGAVPWDSEDDWREAGGRLHALQGMVRVTFEPPGPEDGPAPFACSTWHDSYEAEQHRLHLGRAEAPACWTLTGFASGYLSRAWGEEIVAREARCAATGAPTCRMVARRRADWDAAAGEEIERDYRGQALEASLEAASRALRELEGEVERRRRVLGVDLAVDAPSGLVARSEAMRRVLDVARRVAALDTTVLVTGESGTGKERIARLIHEASPRARGPFVAINCGALEETLLGSELFGHARGAFTGASAERAGVFEAANGGTIFLDEIGEVSPATQVRLLRVLQEREVRRLGETASRRIDVRVVAATNRDLEADVAAGRFREDLLYRLRVVEVHLPPLRDRPEDVMDLARRALASAAERTGRELCGFTPAAAGALLRHAWPGNVRELENAVEHAVALAPGQRVDLADLPAKLQAVAGPASATPVEAAPVAGQTLEEVERAHVLGVLARLGGNRERAAQALGINPATIYRKLKRWGAGDGAMEST